MGYNKHKKKGSTYSPSSYDYDYGDFYGYGGGAYRESSIGFKTSKTSSGGNSWWSSSNWFSETFSREKIKPQLSYWLKRDTEDEFLDTLDFFTETLMNKLHSEPGYTHVHVLLQKACSELFQTLKSNRYGTSSVDYVMLYDIFKIHYYTLKELNFTETSSAYMKLVLKFLDPYADAGGKGFSTRSKALKQAALDFLRVIISLLVKDIEELLKNIDMSQDNPFNDPKLQQFLKDLKDKQNVQDNLDALLEEGFLEQKDLDIDSIETSTSSGIKSLDKLFRELSDNLDNFEVENLLSKITDGATLEGLEASTRKYLEGRVQNKIENAIKRGKQAGKESDLKKTAARAIERLKVNHKKLSGLMDSLTSTMEQNGGIITKRIQQSIYDADTLDCMLELENLSPMLRKITNFDPEVEEVFKKGTVDFYLDISGSMDQGQIDSGLSMILQLHSLGYLGNIYLFESELIYVGQNLDLLPFVTSCGGTSFSRVYHNVKKRDKVSIIYTDGEDSMPSYDPNIYFIGCQGSSFEGISPEYIKSGRTLFYNIRTGDFAKATNTLKSYPFY